MSRLAMTAMMTMCLLALTQAHLREQAVRSSCADLAKLPLPDTTITAAEDVAAGQYTPANGTALIRDFAERSLRELAVKSKAVIRAYYGTPPAFSYWNGCSTGGRQGLMAVQRFPEEYDGLVIGAPAINWDRFIPAELWPQIVMNNTVGVPISAAKLTAVTKAAVAACDANDGVTDGVINDPRKCTYEPRALVCKNGDDPSTCLTSQE